MNTAYSTYYSSTLFMSESINTEGQKPLISQANLSSLQIRASQIVSGPKTQSFQSGKLLSKLAFIIASPAATGKVEPDPSLLIHFSRNRFRSLENWWYLNMEYIKLYLNSFMFLCIKITHFVRLLFLWTCFPLISGRRVLSAKASLQSLKKDLLWCF